MADNDNGSSQRGDGSGAGPSTGTRPEELVGGPPLPPEHADFYRRLRHRLHAFAQRRIGRAEWLVEYLMVGPDLFHLLSRLVLDRSVSLADKAILGAAITYFVTPLDILPEAILGPTGFLDDVALAAYVLRRLLHSNPEAVKRHWAGDGDVVQKIEALVDAIDRMIGVGRWQRVLKYLERAKPADGAEPRDVTPPAQDAQPATDT